MLADIQESQESAQEIFTPDPTVVLGIANDLNEFFLQDKYADTNVMHILIAMEAVGHMIREHLGIKSIEQIGGEDE